MPNIGRRDLVMMLIGLGQGDQLNQPLGGLTRLQKYLFLLEKEGGIQPDGDGFRFEPYKAGPYSAKLYDDLEFLENLGLLDSEVTGTATDEEAVEVERLSIDDLFDDPAVAAGDTSTEDNDDGTGFEERQFSLTSDGVDLVKQMLSNPDYQPVADAVRKVKSRYANHSLSDLLYYVYTKYPDMATASEIRDKVLRRGRTG